MSLPPAGSPSRAALVRAFFDHVPHNRALGMEVLEIEADRVIMRLPYNPDLVGNPDTGVLHGGPVFALMDVCCGAAAFATVPTTAPIATLDLRIDYLKPARAGQAVIAEAVCYKLTQSVAFTRCRAWNEDHPGDDIAHGAGSFMRSAAEKIDRRADS